MAEFHGRRQLRRPDGVHSCRSRPCGGLRQRGERRVLRQLLGSFAAGLRICLEGRSPLRVAVILSAAAPSEPLAEVV